MDKHKRSVCAHSICFPEWGKTPYPFPTLPTFPKYPVDRMVGQDAVCSEGDMKTFLSVLLN